MKKQGQLLLNLIITTFLLLNPISIRAAICVSGSQSGHWGAGTYVVRGAIEVPNDKTLTIDPGAVVYVAPGTFPQGYIRVEGRLIARGVTFIGYELNHPGDPNDCSGKPNPVPGAWVGISFISPLPGSELKNCDILYAGKGGPSVSMSGSSAVIDSNLVIDGCFIAHGADDGIYLATGGSPIIRNTTIHDHAGYGILEGTWSCDPKVDSCAITNCGNYAIRNWADNVKNYHHLFIHDNEPDAIYVRSEDISSGYWENHGVPYHTSTIDASGIKLKDGETLVLEPGVEIQIARPGFTIEGALVADGDSCRHIMFTALDPDDRPGKILYLFNPDNGTILDYCDIYFGGGPEGNASTIPMLEMSDTGNNVVISNCQFTHSNNVGILISGESAPIITNCLFSDIQKEAIRVSTLYGFAPYLRHSLVQKSLNGIVLWSTATAMDLGTLTDQGHNAFINNTEWGIKSNAADTIFAIGNYWVDIDSATIDTKHIYDDDDTSGVAPVIFMPFDLSDMSKPPQTFPCPPSCLALSIAITRPTSNPTFVTTVNPLTLGGTAKDDLGVLSIIWTNTITGVSGEALLGAPRTNLNWTASQIPLVPGNNIISVRAYDLDECTATDDIVINYIEQPGMCWEVDGFDDIPRGASLGGYNGWLTVPDQSSLYVVDNPVGTGHVLKVDTAPNTAAMLGKLVNVQNNGIHSIKMKVLTGVKPVPVEPSLGKVEIRTTGNPQWDKKFQLYFGGEMRLNYGPTRDKSIVFLSEDELAAQQWYNVEVILDMASNTVDVLLDDEVELASISVGPGPITDIGIAAWGRDGTVYFDDMNFCRIDDLPAPDPCKASSYFDIDDEGWKIIGAAQGGTGLPDYFQTGGHPEGYISATDDQADGVWYWAAPNKFLGDAACAYGQALNFDLRQSGPRNITGGQDIILESGSTTLVFDAPNDPDTDWTCYSIPLFETAGWKIDSLSGEVPSQEEMLDVFSDLQRLWICGKHSDAISTTDLDNVVLNGPLQGVGPLHHVSHAFVSEVGDGDGHPEAGETIGLRINLANSGIELATGVTGVLATSDPDINFRSDHTAWLDIPAGDTLSSQDNLEFDINSELLTDKTVIFTLEVSAGNGGPWTSTIEILVSPQNQPPKNLHLFNLSGTENPPFPITVPGSGTPRAVVQNKSGLQITVITDDRMLHVFNLSGTENSPFPVTISGSGTPIDLAQNDEGLQIAVITDDRMLHVFNSSGTENPPFPVTISGSGAPRAVVQNNTGLQIAVITDDRMLHVFNLSGTENPPFPIAIPGSGTPVDLAQNDAGLQIAVITDDRMLHVFNLSGTEDSPFPITIPGSGTPRAVVQNNTGLQIAVITDDRMLHVFNLSGTENPPFPVTISGSGTPVDLAINDTGLQIAVVTYDAQLHVFNLSGTENPPFPITISGGFRPIAVAHNSTGLQIAVATGSEVVPVELISFSAEILDNSIKLTWHTESETNNLGFEVEKSRDNAHFVRIGFVAGNGTTVMPQDYIFTDKDVSSETIYYRLKQIDTNGSFEYSNVLKVEINVPIDFVLYQNYPNPFNAETQISFDLPKRTNVTLRIYDSLGRHVRTLVNESMNAGYYVVLWDGKDTNRLQLSSGLYIYSLNAGSYGQKRKMILLQ